MDGTAVDSTMGDGTAANLIGVDAAAGESQDYFVMLITL